MSVRTVDTGDMDHLVPIAAPPRRIVQFNYEWRIGNFKRAAMKEEVLRSQPFSSKDPQKCKWILELYPHGSPDVYNQGFTSVFLILKECFPDNHTVSVSVQFGIRKFAPEIKDVYFEASDVDFERDRRFGLVKFMSHAELFEKENHFLHHDSMTILCDVKIINAFESASPPPPLPPARSTSFFKRTSSFRANNQKRPQNGLPQLPQNVRTSSSDRSTFLSSEPQPLFDQEASLGTPDTGLPTLRGIEVPTDTLLDDMLKLFTRGRFSDVTLDVGKREFNVHKAILAARSSVFESMFANPSNATSNHYVITDVTSRGMKELLHFIYTGRIDKTESIVEEVLEAAQKYQVLRLQAICESLILRELNVDNAVKTLILAHEHKAQQLKEIVLEFIARNFQTVKRTEGWNVLRSSHTDLYGDIIEFM